eukprot:gene11145-3205_t
MRRRLDCLFVFKRHVNPNSMCLRRASAEMSMLQHLFNCINNTSILTSSVSSRSKPVWHNTRSIFTLSHRRCLEVSKSNFLACRRSLSSWQEEMQKSPAIVVYGLMDDLALQNLFRNFVISIDNIKAGRFWTAVTSSFSHAAFLHFLVNMFIFHSFGIPVARSIGGLQFLMLYFCGAIATATAHVFYHAIVLPSWKGFRYTTDPGSIGASGCVMAVMTLFAARSPHATILLLVIPIPAWLAVSLFVGADIFGAFNAGSVTHKRSRIDNAGHLGGAALGLIWHFVTRGRSRINVRTAMAASSAMKQQTTQGSKQFQQVAVQRRRTWRLDSRNLIPDHKKHRRWRVAQRSK